MQGPGHAAPSPARLPYAEPPEDPAAGSNPDGLLDYWHIIRRRMGTLVLIAFLGCLAGFLLTLPQTPIYQARTSIEVQEMNENFLNMRDMNPTAPAGSMYYPEFDIQTQVKILQSRELLSRVVKKLDIENRPLVVNETRLSAWRRALGLPGSNAASIRGQALGMAAGNLHVRAQANTRLIDILCDSTNPQLAADFLNTLASEFIEENLEARWKTTQHTGEWLSRQMEDLKIKLEKSEEQLQQYARITGLMFTGEKDNIAEEKLKQLQEELSKAQADRVSKQSKYEIASSASTESLPDVLDDGSVKDYQVKLTDLRRQLAELSATYTPAHAKVKKVEAQVGTVEAALSRERGNIIRRIRNDFEAAQRRERLLAASYTAQAALVSEQAANVSHYNILKREVETNRQLYDNMLQRVKEAGIAGALRASNIRVVDPAIPPSAPYKPSLFANSVVGLLGGIFLGLVLVVVRDRADRSIQEPGDSAWILNTCELGIIPRADFDPFTKRRLFPLARADEARRTTTNDLALVTYERKPSVLAESFRSVLTSILFSGTNGGQPRVIVLSSANPKEGKTTVSSNLAIALAEANHRVLLIDGDLRRPRLHQIFELDNKHGLADILSHPGPLNGRGLPPGLIQETGVPNLFMLPCGSPVSVTALIYSKQLPELIRCARAEYDMVLIDAPPMLQMADARVFGRNSDGVILVIRAHQTTRDAARLARQRLAEDGIRLLGTVLNDWNPRRTTVYAYYKYYERYNHYYYKEKSPTAD